MQRVWMLCLMALVVVGCAVGGPAAPGDQTQNPYVTAPPPIQGVTMVDAAPPSWPGTCGYTCNADGFWINTCTGWVADCATSQQHCDKLPPACQDAGQPQEAGCPVTCNPAVGALDCTNRNLGCAGWAAYCPAAPVPSWCSNVCEVQQDPASGVVDYLCVAGSANWTWTDNTTSPATEVPCDAPGQTCQPGSVCTVQVAGATPGQVVQGVCF